MPPLRASDHWRSTVSFSMTSTKRATEILRSVPFRSSRRSTPPIYLAEHLRDFEAPVIVYRAIGKYDDHENEDVAERSRLSTHIVGLRRRVFTRNAGQDVLGGRASDSSGAPARSLVGRSSHSRTPHPERGGALAAALQAEARDAPSSSRRWSTTRLPRRTLSQTTTTNAMSALLLSRCPSSLPFRCADQSRRCGFSIGWASICRGGSKMR